MTNPTSDKPSYTQNYQEKQTPPSLMKKGAALGGRVLTKAVTIPLNFAGNSSQFLSHLFPQGAVQTVSYLGYYGAQLTQQIAEKAGKFVEEGVESGKIQQVTTGILQAAEDQVNVTLEEARDVGKATTEAAKSAISTGGAIVNFIVPGGGSLAARALNTGVVAAQTVQDKNMHLAQLHFSVLTNIVRVISSYVLKLLNHPRIKQLVAHAIVTPTAWASKRLYSLYLNPKSIQEALQSTGDILRTKAITIETKVDEYFRTLLGSDIDKAELPDIELLEKETLVLENFLELPRVEKLAILFQLNEAGKIHIDTLEENDEFHQVIDRLQKVPYEQLIKKDQYCIKRIIREYNKLSAVEQRKLTPEDFVQLTDLKKIHFIKVVYQWSRLSHAERKYILPYVHLKDAKDLENLDPLEQKKLIEFLIRKYNFLDIDKKAELFTFSKQEIETLSQDEKFVILEKIKNNICSNPEISEVKRTRLITKINVLIQLNKYAASDIEFFQKMFRTYLSNAERAAISESHDIKIPLLQIDSAKLPEIIAGIEANLKLACENCKNEKNNTAAQLEAVRIAEMTKYLASIKTHIIFSQEFKVEDQPDDHSVAPGAANKKLRQTRVDKKVNKKVKTEGTLEKAARVVGTGVEKTIEITGKIAAQPFYVAEKYILNQGNVDFALRTGLPLFLSMPNAPVYLYGALSTCVSQETIQTITEWMTTSTSTLLHAASACEKFALDIVRWVRTLENDAWNEYIAPVLKNIKTLRDAEPLKDHTEAVNKIMSQCRENLSNYFEAQIDTYWEKFGSAIENAKLIKPKVQDFFEVISVQYKVNMNSPEFYRILEEKGPAAWKEYVEYVSKNMGWFSGFGEFLTKVQHAYGASGIEAKAIPNTLLSLANELQTVEEKRFLAESAGRALSGLSPIYKFLAPYLPGKEFIKFIENSHKAVGYAVDKGLGVVEAVQSGAETNLDIAAKQADFWINSVQQGTLGTAKGILDVFFDKKTDSKNTPQNSNEKQTSQQGNGVVLNKDEETKKENVATAVPIISGISSLANSSIGKAVSWTMTGAGYALDYYSGQFALKLGMRFLKKASGPLASVLAPTIGYGGGRFLWLLGKTVEASAKTLATISKNTIKEIGTEIQKIIDAGCNIVTGEKIDIKRVNAFLELEDFEKEHIIFLIQNSEKSKEIQEYFTNLIDVAKTDKSPQKQKELAYVLLSIYDTLNIDELSMLSPSLVRGMNESERQKLVEFIDEQVSLSDIEKQAVQEGQYYHICKHFNALSKKRQLEFEYMTPKQFYELSEDEQDEIIYAVAFSSGYLQDLLKRREKAGRKDHQFITQQSTAIQHISLKNMCYHNLRELMTGEELKEVLRRYRKLNAYEMSVLTPRQLLNLGIGKIRYILEEIIKNHSLGYLQLTDKNVRFLPYFTTLFNSLKEEWTGSFKQKRALDLVCALYNEALRPQEKRSLCDLSMVELKTYSKADVLFTLQFLVHIENMRITEKDKQKLQNYIRHLENSSTEVEQKILDDIFRNFDVLTPEQKQNYLEEKCMHRMITANYVQPLEKEKDKYQNKLKNVQKHIEEEKSRIEKYKLEIEKSSENRGFWSKTNIFTKAPTSPKLSELTQAEERLKFLKQKRLRIEAQIAHIEKQIIASIPKQEKELSAQQKTYIENRVVEVSVHSDISLYKQLPVHCIKTIYESLQHIVKQPDQDVVAQRIQEGLLRRMKEEFQAVLEPSEVADTTKKIDMQNPVKPLISQKFKQTEKKKNGFFSFFKKIGSRVKNFFVSIGSWFNNKKK